MATTSTTEPGNDEMLAVSLPAGLEAGPEPALARPNITPAQLVAGVPIIANFGSAFGLFHLSTVQQDALSQAVVWSIGLLAADAAIRIGRALGLRRS